MPFRSSEPWRITPRGIRGAGVGGRESVVLGWPSAAELSWAPGMEGAHGNRTALHRETALPRSSSSAKCSRADGSACRHQGEMSEAERG